MRLNLGVIPETPSGVFSIFSEEFNKWGGLMSSWYLIEEHAREKLKMLPEWMVFSVEVLPPGDRIYYRVSGAIAPLKKNSATPDWRKRQKATEKTVNISFHEHDQWIKEWSEKTGKCSACRGQCVVLKEWNYREGSTWRPCSGCCGTGLRQNREV